jgi:dolichol kinase
MGYIAVVAFGAAAVGAVTELASTKADDNFTIPVAVAVASAFMGL